MGSVTGHSGTIFFGHVSLIVFVMKQRGLVNKHSKACIINIHSSRAVIGFRLGYPRSTRINDERSNISDIFYDRRG